MIRCACGQPLTAWDIERGLTRCIRCDIKIADAALPKTGSVTESTHEDAKWEEEE